MPSGQAQPHPTARRCCSPLTLGAGGTAPPARPPGSRKGAVTGKNDQAGRHAAALHGCCPSTQACRCMPPARPPRCVSHPADHTAPGPAQGRSMVRDVSGRRASGQASKPAGKQAGGQAGGHLQSVLQHAQRLLLAPQVAALCTRETRVSRHVAGAELGVCAACGGVGGRRHSAGDRAGEAGQAAFTTGSPAADGVARTSCSAHLPPGRHQRGGLLGPAAPHPPARFPEAPHRGRRLPSRRGRAGGQRSVR